MAKLYTKFGRSIASKRLGYEEGPEPDFKKTRSEISEVPPPCQPSGVVQEGRRGSPRQVLSWSVRENI